MEDMRFYRYEIGNVTSLGIEMLGRPLLKVNLKLIEFKLVRETPKGYWISEHYESKYQFHSPLKWVSKTGKKRYAYPTKEEALKSRIHINNRRIGFLKRDLEIAEQMDELCHKELKLYEKV